MEGVLSTRHLTDGARLTGAPNWCTYRGDVLAGGALLCHYYLQLFSADTSIHGTHEPSMKTTEGSPRGEFVKILV